MKRLNSYISILLLFAIIFSSCKKEEFPESSPSVNQIFKIEGSIDGQTINLAAGQDGYYLFTDFEENYDGNYLLKANMKNSACSDCDEELSIVLETNTGLYHDNVFTPELISPSSLPFYRNHETEVTGIFSMPYLSQYANFSSNVVNGYITSGSTQELVSISEPINLDYNLLLDDTEIDGDHWISVNNNCSNANVFHGEIFGFNIDEYKENMIIEPPVFTVEGEYNWMLAWNVTGEVFYETHESQTSEPFVLPLEYSDTLTNFGLVMSFESVNGDLIIQNQNNIYPINTTSVPKVPFEVFRVEHFNSPSVTMEYTDSSGNKYVSSKPCVAGFDQNIENSFEISDAEDYQSNENGVPTRLIEFHSTCELINVNDPGDIIIVEGLSGTIALPIP